MDFKKYSAIVAEPPADAGRAASGDSPLQGAVQEALQDGSWRGFLKVPTTVVGKRKRRSDGKEVELHEFEVLCEELKRAARQLDLGLQLRVKKHEDGKSADVYFKAGEKRKYVRQETAEQNGSENGDGSTETAESDGEKAGDKSGK